MLGLKFGVYVERLLVGVGMGGGHGFIGGKAAVFDGATGIVAHFKLDGGVVDVESYRPGDD